MVLQQASRIQCCTSTSSICCNAPCKHTMIDANWHFLCLQDFQGLQSEDSDGSTQAYLHDTHLLYALCCFLHVCLSIQTCRPATASDMQARVANLLQPQHICCCSTNIGRAAANIRQDVPLVNLKHAPVNLCVAQWEKSQKYNFLK